VAEAAPVDEARIARLYMAARLILDRPDRHTPLERQWAKEVFDLTVALQAARQEIARLQGESPAPDAP
jgi:hypothetical protein